MPDQLVQPVQRIGKMSLYNNSGVVVRISFKYFDEKTGQIQRAKSSGDITGGFTKTADPGDDTFKVPEGSMFYMHADVAWNADTTAKRAFIYERGNAAVARYEMTGAWGSTKLKLNDVGPPGA